MDLAGEGPMEVTDVPTNSPTQVPVASCARRPDNPRPKQPVVNELASTIQEVGQLQPATIASRAVYLEHRPEHADAIGNAEWVVLYGNRRHLACEQAGVEQLLVHVADDRVADVIETGIIENIQREPLLPVREAEELKQLHKRYGTTRAVGDKIGKTHVYVSQRLSLLDLVEELQNAVDDGKLSITNARELAKLPAEQQLPAHETGPPYKPVSSLTEQQQPIETPDRTPTPSAEAEKDATATGDGLGEGPQRGSGGNVVSKPATTSATSTADEADPSGAHVAEPIGTAMIAREPKLNGGGAGNGVSSTSAKFVLPEPITLVQQMRSEYTADQLHEIIKLLRE